MQGPHHWEGWHKPWHQHMKVAPALEMWQTLSHHLTQRLRTALLFKAPFHLVFVMTLPWLTIVWIFTLKLSFEPVKVMEEIHFTVVSRFSFLFFPFGEVSCYVCGSVFSSPRAELTSMWYHAWPQSRTFCFSFLTKVTFLSLIIYPIH